MFQLFKKLILTRDCGGSTMIAMDLGPEQFGRWFIWIGLLMAALGGLFILFGKLGLFRLPGDIQFGSSNWRIYMPIASSIIISIVLTLILWLLTYLRR